MAEYIRRCDLSAQYRKYQKEINRSIGRVLDSGVYILGKEGELFEKEFAEYIGRAFGIAVASGTDALILALKAAGLKEGDEVITTDYSPVPVPTAIVLAGGIPVFADIEEDSCLIDHRAISKRISNRTKFIMPVHLFGAVCDMAKIGKIAAANGLKIIEDASQAHGSTYGGKKSGNFGSLSCFSFYPTKNLGGYGDGGIVLTDSQNDAKLLRMLRNYGKRDNPFDSEIIGYNSRLDELQAAILRVKLRYLDKMNRQRAELVNMYRKGLKDLPVTFLKEYRNTGSNYHVLTVLCREGRDELIRFLQANNIQTNIYYPRPLHSMKAFKRYVKNNEYFPVSEKISKEALALPIYPELEKDKVIFIIKKITDFFTS